jgi:hypothetical protein
MASVIEDLCRLFKVVGIYMDAGGGGLPIKDILAENRQNHPDGPLLDLNDEVYHAKHGRKILTMCNFSTSFIEDSNNMALNLLEQGQLNFPTPPRDYEPSPLQEESFLTITRMQQQMQTIEISETKTGKLHFDVPKGEGHGRQKKDLYTSFMLAARCIYDMLWSEGLPDSILHHGGKAIPRQSRGIITGGQIGEDHGGVPQVLRDKLDMLQNPAGYRDRLLANRVDGRRRRVLSSPAAVLQPVYKPNKK